MPYLDDLMASHLADSIGSKSLNSSKSGKVVRTLPSENCSKTSKQANVEPSEEMTTKYKLDLDQRKLLFMRNLLKSEV